MRFLKADTSIKVVIGPVVASANGITPQTLLTLSSADEAEIMKHDAAATTGISGNTWASIGNMDGYYNLTLTATDTNTEGMLTLGINDDDLCLPVYSEFTIMNANAYDSLFAVAGTDKLQIDVVEVGGNTNLPELSQAQPAATPTLEEAMMLLYMALRNKITTTATQYSIYNDAGTEICTASLADDGTTFTRSEIISG